MKIGYVKFSSLDQNLNLQMDAFINLSFNLIYQENVLGKNQEFL